MAGQAEEFSRKTGLDVSRETLARLERYESLLRKWNPAINLVGRNTLPRAWGRHFIDSAQLWRLRPKDARLWLDLGSGGGFPGLVVAVLAAERDPALRVALVESDGRKASFLSHVCQELGISPKIHRDRAETLAPQGADLVSARALAPLDRLLELAHRHLAPGGVCLFPKGKNSQSELTRARKYWTFDIQQTPSVTDSGGTILKIGGLGRVSPQ